MLDYCNESEKEEVLLESATDVAMDRGVFLFESVIKKKEINMKEAELKVMEESGAYEDLEVLYEAAAEEATKMKKNVLLKMIDAIKAFIDSIATKIKSVFTKQVIEDAKKAAATAPDIEVSEDPKTVFAKLKGKIEGIFNAITHPGASLKSYQEWYDKKEAEYEASGVKARNNKTAKKATIILSAAALAAPYVIQNIPKMLEAAKKSVGDGKSDDSEAATKIKHLQSACKEMVAFANDMIGHSVNVAKSGATSIKDTAVNAATSVKNTAVNTAKGIKDTVTGKAVKESVDDDIEDSIFGVNLDDDAFTESVDMADDVTFIEDLMETV